MRICVYGYQKSGTTWVARLFGDYLDAPIKGSNKERVPLSLQKRPSTPDGTVVIQEHFLDLIADHWRRVHVVRDPRDVAVSAYYYYGFPSISDTLDAMYNGTGHFRKQPPYNAYITSALQLEHYRTYYEVLSATAYWSMALLLDVLGFDLDDQKLNDVAERQSFANVRNLVNLYGDDMPHGKEAQLKLLRKGKVGEWQKEFSLEDAEKARKYFGDALKLLRYEYGDNWVKEWSIAR